MQCHPPLKHRRKLQARVSPLSTSQLAPDLHKELGGVASQNVSLAHAATLIPTIQSKPAALGRAAGYLHRMQPRLGASNSFHGRHSHMVQGADGGQAGIGRKVAGTQIKVIPLTTQAIRTDPSAESERFVMLRVTFLTLHCVLFSTGILISPPGPGPEHPCCPVGARPGVP